MTNGGVMIGSTDSTRSAPLNRKPVRVAISAKARPSAVAADADEDAEEQRVPRHAAAQLPAKAVEAPDRAVGELGHELAGAKPPALSCTALARIVETGKNTNSRISADHGADRRHHEHVAATPPARGEPAAEDEQERSEQRDAAQPHAVLPGAGRAEQRGQPFGVPAPQSDAEALSERQGKAQQAGGDKQLRARLHIVARQRGVGREAQWKEQGKQPPCA